jgi:hypothetical protein
MTSAEPRGRRSPHASGDLFADEAVDEAIDETADDLTPWDQIARRNEASRADATVLAPQRQAAASRALVILQRQIERDLAGDPEPRRPSPRPEPAHEGGPAVPSATLEEPLLEVKGSALGNDPEHRGERLVIFRDRVELRDRHDDLRVIVRGEEIARVTVQRRITGAVLSVASAEGPLIVARGLRPDQALQARLVILREVRVATPPPRQRSHNLGDDPAPRPARPRARDLVDPQPAAPLDAPILTAVSQELSRAHASPEQREEPPSQPIPAASASRFDEAELLRKLGDLHRAGVLTIDEYEDKIELVARLVTHERSSPLR